MKAPQTFLIDEAHGVFAQQAAQANNPKTLQKPDTGSEDGPVSQSV